ncbi:aldo/keto reductase [Paenibacillus pectinilyticus]|uniref:Aldo/keto reductase n=1 Tax=Paenibacillus pectinilyticus TaxID=512399 RepID=A0A1C0ZXY2_9BACL|nr:aldo/keto reductase [Paenibacillus pectinilyticus]OCT12880.1 aldo/keto reductase [Paenibacillus pectinilyticus]
MKYRTYGKTGWRVSEIGFGAWGLGGDMGPVEDGNSIKLLLSAWERGINFVDTAQMYGKGRSESVIGAALKQWHGDHIYIATKVQPVEWPHPSIDNPDMASRYPAAYLREQCEASLRRLGLETIDVYQLHGWFTRGIEETEWFDTLSQLKQEGKIRAIGVSIRDYRPEDGIEIAKRGMTESEQVIFNLFEQRPIQELFPVCEETGVAVLARVPFDEGSLTGTWTKDTYNQFAPEDFRRHYFKNDRFARTFDKVEMMKAVIRQLTGDQYTSLAEVALRYSLSHPAVSCSIPGMSSIRSLEANIKVSDGEPLPTELLEALQPFNWPRNYHNPDETN